MNSMIRNSCLHADERAARTAAIYQRAMAAATEHYDPARHLVASPATVDRPRTYRPPTSLPLAEAWLASGDPALAAEAEAIVAAVLDTQETDAGHPHCGNWLWLAGDPEVVDLNAVQFALRALLPLLVRHSAKLSPTLLARCRTAVRLSLEEEVRLDVGPCYSNIHIMSLLALVVGGEWLGDVALLAIGRERWARWARLTVAAGAPYEYASPSYGAIDLGGLAALASLVRDATIRLQAWLLYERIWLHLLHRIHLPTGQVAAPHCRCYWPLMATGRGPVKDLLWLGTGWPWLLEPAPTQEATLMGYGAQPQNEPPASLELALTPHWWPVYIASILTHSVERMPYEVREVASVETGYDTTTYMTPNYALGTASTTYSIGTECFYIDHHANYLMLHYARPGRPQSWGMAYSRYVINDRHWGTLGAAPDRPKHSNFYDQGHFAGVQCRNAAIGLYALMPEQDEVHSAKTVVAFQAGADLDEVWLNDQQVDLESLPFEAHEGDWLVVADGAVYVGVHILARTRMGTRAPIQLERGPLGELWLTISNYQGTAKRFWNYASLRGAFWRGNIRAGYVMEVADREAYGSASAFLDHLRRAEIEDTVDDDHVRTVRYRNGETDIALDYDLWNTRPAGRRIDDAPYAPPNLRSPFAAQGDAGTLRVGKATLTTAPGAMVWLIAQESAPEARQWVAVNPLGTPTPLRLETPCGVATAEVWGLGRIAWRAPADGSQELVVDAAALPKGLRVPRGVAVIRREHPAP